MLKKKLSSNNIEDISKKIFDLEKKYSNGLVNDKEYADKLADLNTEYQKIIKLIKNENSTNTKNVTNTMINSLKKNIYEGYGFEIE